MRNSNTACGYVTLVFLLILVAGTYLGAAADGWVRGMTVAILFIAGESLIFWITYFRDEWEWRLPKWEILISFVCLWGAELLVGSAHAWLWRTNWLLVGSAFIFFNLPNWLKRKYPAHLSLAILGILCVLGGIFAPQLKLLDPAMQRASNTYQQLRSSIFPVPTPQIRPSVSTVPTAIGNQLSTIPDLSCTELLKDGVDWQNQTNSSEAMRSYQQALSCYQKGGDLIGEAITLDRIGRIHESLGEFKQALDSLQQELELWQTLGNEVNQAITLNLMGMIYENMGDHQNALRNFQYSLDLAQKSGDLIGEARALNSLGQLSHTLGDHEQAIQYNQDALKIIRVAGNQNLEVLLLNNLGLSYFANGNSQEASRYLNEAVVLARQINDASGERMVTESLKRLDEPSANNEVSMQVLHLDEPGIDNLSPYPASPGNDDCNVFMQQAVDLHNQGFDADALENFQQALVCYQESNDPVAQGGALYGMGTMHIALGHPDQALIAYRQALTIARQTNDKESQIAGFLSIGSLEQALRMYDAALTSYQEMILVARNIGDQHNEALALSKRGGVYHELGQYGAALDDFRTALLLFYRLEEDANIAASLVNMGTCFDRMGNYREALKYHQRALEIARETGDRSVEASTLLNMGGVHFRLEDYQKALDFYAQSLDLTRQDKDVFQEAQILSDYGKVQMAMGSYEEAIRSYNQSLEIYLAMNDPLHEADILGKLGEAYTAQGKYQSAIQYYNRSILINQNLADTISEGSHVRQVASVYVQMGQLDAALFHYQQAFDLFQGIENEMGQALTQSDMGRIYQLQDQPDKALDRHLEAILHFQNTRSIDLIEDIHHTLPDEILSSSQNAILLLVRMGRHGDALGYTEEARGRGLASQLYEARLNRFIDSRIPGSSDIQKLDSEIWFLDQQLQRELLKPTREQNRDLIFSLVDKLASKRSELQQLTGIYGSPDDLIFNVAPLTLPEIQALLNDQTLVEYVVTPEATIAFVVTSQQLQAVELDVSQEELSQQINSFHQFSSLEGVPEASQTLYRMLVAPIASYISNDRLLIAPNGILHYVPFGALHDGTQYLIEKYTLFYTPSASMYPFALDNEKAVYKPPLIFSDPTGDLPNARAEALQIHLLYTFSLKTLPLHEQSDALERWVWEQADQAGILHFATHGVYDPRNPLFSYILLAGDEQEDGHLDVYEIYQRGLNLNNASLVVLSACETNVGSMSNGDEIVGLSRAFMFAGAPTIVSSLWSVDDESTQILMEHFYSQLNHGKTKAEALRAAQLQMLSNPQYAHPYYWGAFNLTGDPGEMPQGNIFITKYWGSIQIGLLILGFISLRFVNSRVKPLAFTKGAAVFWGWLIGLLGLPILFLGLFLLGYLIKENIGISLVPQDIIHYILPARNVIMKDLMESYLFGAFLVLWGGSLAAFGANLREGRLGKRTNG